VAGRQEQGQREERVEHHLEIQRPADKEDGLERAGQVWRGDEGETFHDGGKREIGLREEPGSHEGDQQGERGGGPVERHDPGRALGDEPGRGFIGGGRVDHDETGEHEEEVDAGLADLEAAHAEAGVGMQEFEHVEGDDGIGHKRPQNL
jgi:hypothetical protein